MQHKIAIVLSLGCAASCLGQCGPLWEAFGDEESYFGQDVLYMGDLDGDGTGDVFTRFNFGSWYDAVDAHRASDGKPLGRVGQYYLDGRTFVAAPLGDVNGDGQGEWVLGGSGEHVAVISGLHDEIWRIETDIDNYSFGMTVMACGDLDGDNVSEFMFSDAYYSTGGRFLLFSGATQELLHTFEGDGSRPFWRGSESIPDINDDGVRDIVIDTSNGTQVYYSGADFTEIAERPDVGSTFVDVGDIDSDGTPDFAAFIRTNNNDSPGSARIVSGRTGALLAEVSGEFEPDSRVFSGFPAGDWNRDGVPDVVVTQSNGDGSDAIIRSGDDLRELFTLTQPGSFGTRGAFVPDIPGRGPALVMGSPNALSWSGKIGTFALCVADFDCSGDTDTLDVLAFLNAFADGDARADLNGDDALNTLDVLAFLNAWAQGCKL